MVSHRQKLIYHVWKEVEKKLDEYVLAFWRAHHAVPSDVGLDFYREVPDELLDVLHRGFD